MFRIIILLQLVFVINFQVFGQEEVYPRIPKKKILEEKANYEIDSLSTELEKFKIRNQRLLRKIDSIKEVSSYQEIQIKSLNAKTNNSLILLEKTQDELREYKNFKSEKDSSLIKKNQLAPDQIESYYTNSKYQKIAISSLLLLFVIFGFFYFSSRKQRKGKINNLSQFRELGKEDVNRLKSLAKRYSIVESEFIYNNPDDLISSLEKYFETQEKLKLFKEEISDKISNWLSGIEKAKSKLVIDDMLTFVKANNLKNIVPKMVNISSQFSFLNDRQTQGVISEDRYLLEMNKINSSLIQIIFEIEK